jgi:hypothetical protein
VPSGCWGWLRPAHEGRLESHVISSWCSVRLRVGRPASAEHLERFEAHLHPDLVEFARVANGLRFSWWEGSTLQGALHLPTLAQFARSRESHGLEPDLGRVHRFNWSPEPVFIVLVEGSERPFVFDGDFCREGVFSSLADALVRGCSVAFRDGWEADLMMT